MALLDVVDATLLRGRSPSPPFGRAGLTCSRGRGGLAAVGVAAGRADVRRWQRRVVAAAGSGSYWRVCPQSVSLVKWAIYEMYLKRLAV